MADKQTKTAAKKPIRVLRRRKVLHLGIDLAHAPWIRTLVRALPANIENHASHADDQTASLLQLHRPNFPDLKPGAALWNTLNTASGNWSAASSTWAEAGASGSAAG